LQNLILGADKPIFRVDSIEMKEILHRGGMQGAIDRSDISFGFPRGWISADSPLGDRPCRAHIDSTQSERNHDVKHF
jgi:hypothetical protein